jgi:hypothetical protein
MTTPEQKALTEEQVRTIATQVGDHIKANLGEEIAVKVDASVKAMMDKAEERLAASGMKKSTIFVLTTAATLIGAALGIGGAAYLDNKKANHSEA